MMYLKPNTHREDCSVPAHGESERRSSFFTVYVYKWVFGLEVKDAQAIFRVGLITPIPLAHNDIAGFINLRGKVVTAVSLRSRLGALKEDSGESIAIAFERRNEHFVLLVDRVGDVLSLPDSARTQLPPHCDSAQSRYTCGLYAFESSLIPILDVERLFNFAV
ncbi:MAG: chemotaxis protein CheW [Rhodomicrobium sp.]